MAPPVIALTKAQQKIFDAYVKAIPGITEEEKKNLRFRIRQGVVKAKDFKGRLLINDDILRKEYKKFQKQFKNRGTDTQFATYLNKKYVPKIGDSFNADSLYAVRKRLDIKSPVKPGEVPTLIKRQADINKLLRKEIDKANAGEKYITQDSIAQKVKKKLKLPEGFVNIKNAPDAYPILSEVDTRANKIEKVMQNMLLEDKPLKQNWGLEVIKRTGMGPEAVRDNLRAGNVPTFNKYKDKGADYILRNYGRTFPKVFYTLPFADQLSYAVEMQEGRPTYTNVPGGNRVRYGSRPDQKIMAFALRSWNQNEGEGPVKFFNKKTGAPIPWQFGLKLPYNDVAFSYDGKLHTYKDLNDVRYARQYFPEAYDKITKLNKLKSKFVDNPFKKGQIRVEDLVKEIQVKGYTWEPNAPKMDILHGPKGVRLEPFTNLSFNSRDINQLGAGIVESTSLGKGQKQKALKLIGQALPGDESDIIQRQVGLAEKIKKGTMFGYKDMSGAVRGLFEQFDKPTILQIRRAVGCDNADGGRIELQAGGDLLACPTKKFQNDPVGFTNKVNQIQQPTSGITKFTNAALGFLKAPGIRGFGAAAIAGAAGAGLVKQFNNNDPTTYLSNEDQQKSMLVDMATDSISTSFDRPAILDYQLPALGAEAAAGLAVTAPSTIKASKSRAFGIEKKRVAPGTIKTGARVLGRGLASLGTPLALLPMEAMNITSQIAEGDSPLDIATDPLNYLGATFAEPATKIASRGVNPKIATAMRLGMSPTALRLLSRAGGIGLGASLGIMGLQKLSDL